MATLDPGARLARASLIFALTGLALTVLRVVAFLGGGPLVRAIPALSAGICATKVTCMAWYSESRRCSRC